MRIPKLIPIVAIVFAVPFLMGTEECHDKDPLGLVKAIVKQVVELEERVGDLEACDCEGILEPVCGENGDTYINACEAECVGVEVESSGECMRQVCGGDTGMTCEEGSFCEVFEGCDESEVGRCEGIPELCTREYAPVCGCDARTYDNDCERRSAGVSLDRPGECDPSPEVCEDNDGCREGQYCRKAPDSCDELGVCAPKPMACTREYAPVCGCDDKSYANACQAASRGASVDHRGRCEEKAYVCHTRGRHDKTLHIGRPAVDAHLRHGDYRGWCKKSQKSHKHHMSYKYR